MLRNKKMSVVVTAGPTREKIDPIRFISNYSTGRFGYEIAGEAKRIGWRVTLISGPVALEAPKGVKLIRVESALQMRDAVERRIKGADCLIMAAAVSDWRVKSPAMAKIKRRRGEVNLKLIENPDIIARVDRRKKRPILVGFALETADLEKNALNKLRDKKLDIIIANKYDRNNNAFGDRKTSVLIIDRFGDRAIVKSRTKPCLAKIILDKISNFNI